MTASRPFSFARLYRLTRPAEFQSVFGRARRSADRYFTVLYRDTREPSARLGFAIAKKRIASAAQRNRLRRIGRESFRHQRDKLGGVDIIILGQAAAVRATNAELFASLEKHWRKLAARQPESGDTRPAASNRQNATKDNQVNPDG